MNASYARFANTTRQAARDALRARTASSAYPVISKCPSPSCECAEMPSDLDIERERPLNGSMPAHDEQLLIASNQADWTSKIEDEKDTAPWGELAFNIKKIMGRDGEYHDPYRNIAVYTCSFEEPLNGRRDRLARAFLFPSFKMIDQIRTEPQSTLDFVKTFLLPSKLHPQHNSLSEKEKSRMTRDAGDASSPRWADKVKPISTPTIMVCSHNSRDTRCGVLGPLLHAEFTQYINKRHTLRNHALPRGNPYQIVRSESGDGKSFASHPEFKASIVDQEKNGMHPINVGMISHVGGHKWAGNVIVYIPPEYCCIPIERVKGGPKPEDLTPVSNEKVVSEEERGDEILESETSPLAGKTIWYGRVEPRHVEGIVEQTIGHGKIIGELFRGGVNADGSFLRI